jgi:hypothetical protein
MQASADYRAAFRKAYGHLREKFELLATALPRLSMASWQALSPSPVCI